MGRGLKAVANCHWLYYDNLDCVSEPLRHQQLYEMVISILTTTKVVLGTPNAKILGGEYEVVGDNFLSSERVVQICLTCINKPKISTTRALLTFFQESGHLRLEGFHVFWFRGTDDL